MENQLRIFKKDGLFHCELWIEQSQLRNDGYYFEDKVTAISWEALQVEIGNKNWLELLNK